MPELVGGQTVYVIVVGTIDRKLLVGFQQLSPLLTVLRSYNERSGVGERVQTANQFG